MTSKTSWDNTLRGFWGVLRWQLRRCLPLGSIYLAVMLVIGLFDFWRMPSEKIFLLYMPVLAMTLVLPAFQLGDCFSRRQADFFHALPVGRGAFFWGTFLSSLVWLLVPLFPSLGANGLMCLLATGSSVHQDTCATLLFLLASGGACLALFTLAAVGSGSYLGYGMNALFLSVCWPVLAVAFQSLVRETVPYTLLSSNSSGWLTALGSPPVSATIFCPRPYRAVPGWQLWWWVLFAVLLALAACFLYRRRSSENAGAFWTCKPMEYLTRTMLGTAAAFAVGGFTSFLLHQFYFYKTFPFAKGWGIPLTLTAMALTLTGAWLVTELLYHHGLKGLLKRWRFLASSAALTLLLTAVMSTGMGLDTALPKLEDIVFATIDGPSVGMAYTNIADPDDPRASYAIMSGFSSRENLEKLLELQEKTVELERASQFPYLPGRDSYGSMEGDRQAFTFNYRLKDNEYFWRSFSFQSRRTEQTQALYEEFQSMLRELLSSEEYVSGLFPVCAVDGADKIGKVTLREEKIDPKDQPYLPTYADVLCDKLELPENAKSIDSLPGNFRRKLEEALRDDLSHGRCPSYEEIQEKYGGGKSTEIYEIYYPAGQTFTARGGTTDSQSEPAAGRKWTLASLYSYADQKLTPAFRVLPEMTQTYALLKAQYENTSH